MQAMECQWRTSDRWRFSRGAKFNKGMDVSLWFSFPHFWERTKHGTVIIPVRPGMCMPHGRRAWVQRNGPWKGAPDLCTKYHVLSRQSFYILGDICVRPRYDEASGCTAAATRPIRINDRTESLPCLDRHLLAVHTFSTPTEAEYVSEAASCNH